MPVPDLKLFSVRFVGGVWNPKKGPYSYEYIQIEFVDEAGYSINKVTQNSAFITVKCSNSCDTCQDTLSKCTSCAYDVTSGKSYFLKASQYKCVEDCGSGFFQGSGY